MEDLDSSMFYGHVYFVFVIKIILIMEMSYLNPYYPFLHASTNPYYYCMPQYPFEPFYVEPPSIPAKSQHAIKIEESAPKKQKSAAKILARIKKLIKQLHRDDILNRKTHWTAEEDQLLRKLVQEEKLEWKAIPHHFRERTQNMCYSRYRRLQSERKQKKWTRVQEEQLISFVQKHGEKWKKISQELTNFTPKQIRERYLNYLRPNIDRSDFSIEEDFKICKFVIQTGKHWRKLEESLPGRPEGTIKSRFYAKLQDIIQTAHQDDD